jgi:hypothetical protein
MHAKGHNAGAATPGPVVLFGIDSHGKPKAARFGKNHAGVAFKAASQLQLQVLAANDPKVAEIAARLPVGRIHATGRTFIPFVRRDLYDKLSAIASNGKGQPLSAAAATTGVGASGAKPSGATPNLPENWDKIGVGDLVVAQESPEDGWYLAIVMEANGDMFTLRWRDYPGGHRFMRHRNRLGLLYSGNKPVVDPPKSAKANAAAKQDKAAAQNTMESKSLPRRWSEINVGHLVLAKSDGPWRDYWEAVPIELTSDLIKLRWQDEPGLPPITRSRFDLALICPEAV